MTDIRVCSLVRNAYTAEGIQHVPHGSCLACLTCGSASPVGLDRLAEAAAPYWRASLDRRRDTDDGASGMQVGCKWDASGDAAGKHLTL